MNYIKEIIKSVVSISLFAFLVFIMAWGLRDILTYCIEIFCFITQLPVGHRGCHNIAYFVMIAVVIGFLVKWDVDEKRKSNGNGK